MIHTVNIAPIFSMIIYKGMCTKRELEEYYTFFDALDMYEILIVSGMNDAAAEGAALMKSRRR